jgi:hypothetical protein
MAMLGRYVGVTLLMLGGAMLLAPDGPDRETAGATPAAAPAVPTDPDATPVLASARAGAASSPPAVPAGEIRPVHAQAEAAVPDAGPESPDGAGEPSLAIHTTRYEGPTETMDMSVVEGIPRGERMMPPRSLDDAIDEAVAAAPIPSLSRPGTVMEPSAITPETLALIAAAGISEPDAALDGAPDATPDAREDPAAPGLQTLYVSGTRVNVRSGPSTSFAVIGSLGYGEAVELVADSDGSWAEVRLSDARTGFMSRNFLEARLPGE